MPELGKIIGDFMDRALGKDDPPPLNSLLFTMFTKKKVFKWHLHLSILYYILLRLRNKCMDGFICIFTIFFFVKIIHYILSPPGFSTFCEGQSKKIFKNWNPTHHPISAKYLTQALLGLIISNKRILDHTLINLKKENAASVEILT